MGELVIGEFPYDLESRRVKLESLRLVAVGYLTDDPEALNGDTQIALDRLSQADQEVARALAEDVVAGRAVGLAAHQLEPGAPANLTLVK